MSDEFLNGMREAPRPAFVHAMRERLRGLDAADERRAAAGWPTPVLATAAVVLLVAGSLAFPAVRATARAFLDLFHDRSVKEIRFDPSRFVRVREGLEGRSPALLVFDEPEVLQDPGAPLTSSMARAAS